MARETKAEMAARHDRELREAYEARDKALEKANARADHFAETADRLSLQLAQAHEEITRSNHRNDAMRAALVDGQRERDVLRGFVFREIPVRLADLPAPIATALGVYVPGEA